jgi:hypothetical protein
MSASDLCEIHQKGLYLNQALKISMNCNGLQVRESESYLTLDFNALRINNEAFKDRDQFVKAIIYFELLGFVMET